MKNIILMAAVILGLSVSGCETIQNSGDKEKVGAVGGAILGGLAGSQVGSGSGRLWATGVGTLLGVLVGSEVGRSLDKADMAYAQRANYQAHSSPIGESITWDNPESGNSGSVTPVREGSDTAGRYCREYQQTIYVGGQQETGYGIACRQEDGTWEIVS
ncbi:MAG: glycine zipper 2TM domain-containing protein [Rhodospirillales bacterium]|nr:glycine zipper 2TM domain-containing protein [Alphaproteobacteria bacterium]USO03584.1 MAG: glycine zipper 2TM domain-containing protein [Rhodospirillales bacterium]